MQELWWRCIHWGWTLSYPSVSALFLVAEEHITLRLFDDVSRSHVILYLPKYYTTQKYICMHIYIYDICDAIYEIYATWADNTPHKNHRLIKTPVPCVRSLLLYLIKGLHYRLLMQSMVAAFRLKVSLYSWRPCTLRKRTWMIQGRSSLRTFFLGFSFHDFRKDCASCQERKQWQSYRTAAPMNYDNDHQGKIWVKVQYVALIWSG